MNAIEQTGPLSLVPRSLPGADETDRRAASTETTGGASGEAFSFGDFIDVINPLQHIPGIAEIYRSVTNDRISDDARKTGNALYGFALGGPIGLGAMLAYNAVGDRLYGNSDSDPSANMTLTGAVDAPTSNDLEIVPVPDPRPIVRQDDGPIGPEQEQMLLGEKVAATGTVLETEPNPRDLAEPVISSLVGLAEDRNEKSEEFETKASSVSYLDDPVIEEPQSVLPSEASLGRLAAHKANHLPLDVLKALQERYAERSASERS